MCNLLHMYAGVTKLLSNFTIYAMLEYIYSSINLLCPTAHINVHMSCRNTVYVINML